MRLLQRALRRSGLLLAYSTGFNPRLRLNLALPLPLGVTAGRELGEVHLSEQIEPAAFISALSPQLPEGLKLIDAVESTEQAPPLAARVTAARYRAILKSRTEFPEIQGKIGKAVADLLKDDEILSPRTDKKKRKISYTNIRPYIYELDIAENHQEIVLSMLVKAGSEGGVSPSFLLQKIEEKGIGFLRRPISLEHRARSALYFRRRCFQAAY
jgi:radical SAM-linked protein